MAAGFSPPSRQAAIAKLDASVLWSLQSASDCTSAISCHAISAGERLIALCPNTEEIQLWEAPKQAGGEFRQIQVLVKHTQRVTGLSFSCENKLVSVSEDRTAIVWEQSEDGSTWKHVLVELRAPRAASCVEWAPNGSRFAVGLASRDCAICHFEPMVNCWVAKKVGRARAAVRAIAWHPSSQFLATGSTDRKLSIYDVNEAGDPPFGEAQVTEDSGAWVSAIAFSSTGFVLGFTAQDSAVRFKNLQEGPQAPLKTVRWRRLPFMTLAFVGDDKTAVACGFDYVPVILKDMGGFNWQVAATVEAGSGPKANPSAANENFDKARQLFRTKSGVAAKDVSGSWHTNTITCLSAMGPKRFATSGLDGLMVMWEMAA